ncbi:MAG: hypothetical protein AAE977_01440 [Thermoplasmataceae archaeon]|jgi:5-methyltetrahydropteroyltriglutamate--homocysteine methyltransferase
MVKIEKLVYGIYPRSEALRVRIGRWERGLFTSKDLVEIMEKEKLIHYTENIMGNRIDFFTDPMFNWNDIFRPLCPLIDGIVLGPLTRYRNTNTFYRRPEIYGRLKLSSRGKSSPDQFDTIGFPLYSNPGFGEFYAFLPSPLSFLKMADIKSGNREMIIKDLMDIYSDLMDANHLKKILIYEAMPYSRDDDLSFLDKLNDNFTTMLVSTGKIFGENLRGMKSEFFAITSPESADLPVIIKHARVAGIETVDSFTTSTKVDEKSAIVATFLAEQNDLDRIIITHNDYLDFLPREIADRKVAIMGMAGVKL